MSAAVNATPNVHSTAHPKAAVAPIVVHGTGAVVFDRPLALQPRAEGGLVVIADNELGIAVHGTSLVEATDALHEQIAIIWSLFVQTPDDKLLAPSLRVKHRWLNRIGGYTVGTAAVA